VGTGGRTKFNRIQQHYPKTHWLDAVCVGESGRQVFVHPDLAPLSIKATGRGSRPMCSMSKYGFPRTGAKQLKQVKGFQTGDIVKATVPAELKKAGTYVGRVLVRASGSFDISTQPGRVQGVSHKYCKRIHPIDGYSYQKGEAAFPPHA